MQLPVSMSNDSLFLVEKRFTTACGKKKIIDAKKSQKGTLG